MHKNRAILAGLDIQHAKGLTEIDRASRTRLMAAIPDPDRGYEIEQRLSSVGSNYQLCLH